MGLLLQHTSYPRPRRLAAVSLAAAVFLCALSTIYFRQIPTDRLQYAPPLHYLDDFWVKRMPPVRPSPPLAERESCYGPRGVLLSDSPDDALRSENLIVEYPVPFIGSHDDLGLEHTWMTADGRYGAYGYGEDNDEYDRSRVNWDNVDWGKLQNECFQRNEHRFPNSATTFTNERRFDFVEAGRIPRVRTWDEFRDTRRTALVVRAYSGYTYTQDDLYNIRSLIVEAALKSGGEYQVILLVNLRGEKSNIFASKEAYDRAFKAANIPKEFHSIAVLWDESFLRSWYSKVMEHRTEWQVFQPMQLLALHYPEFDHYWQIEMDMRFMGDAGKYLDALATFAREEPRKQALERSTFLLLPSKEGNYANLSAVVNEVNRGGSHVWGPLDIQDIAPIGPEPPVSRPEYDDFQWGVGEEADLITTSYCSDVLASKTWLYRDWIYGFWRGAETPRFFCPPAVMRTSRSLLLAIHDAQHRRGMRIPSEATPPSFALWHGLKLSYPPSPVYMLQHNDPRFVDGWYRGGPGASSTGLGPDILDHPRGEGLSWWWEGAWPHDVFERWVRPGPNAIPETLPFLLAVKEGQVYAPNFAMHPVKTQI